MIEDRFTQFTIKIARVNKLVQRIKTTGMQALHLKSGHMLCLYQLNKSDGHMTFGEIVQNCDFDKSFASRILKDLIENKLIAKEGAIGRYKTSYLLTDRALPIVNKINLAVEDVIQQVNSEFSDQEIDEFFKVIDRFQIMLQMLDTEFKKRFSE